MRKVLTLCIIHQGNKVLLGMKKRDFGAGRWNGFGGKLDGGETIEEAMKREVLEEAGIEVLETEKMGVMNFEFQNNPGIYEVHIFKAEKFEGEPKETEEMKPVWFEVKNIPFDKMWPSDDLWYKLFLENKKFKGNVVWDNPIDAHILEHKIETVEKL